jgi:GT2 family glycosyltransferase
MKKIGIIIVNYNGEKDTNDLLDSLEKINKDNFSSEIYIIDNGSSSQINHSDRIITCHYQKNSHNLGFAGANNLGIKKAIKDGCDYVCLLNNDTIVHPDFLLNLLLFFEKNQSVGIASPKIYFSKGREFHKNRYQDKDRGKVIWYAGGLIDWKNVHCSHRGVDEVDSGQYDTVVETDFATGCCMFIRKDIIEKIGNLNAKYFAYFEDVDFCVRAKKAGYQIKYVPESLIWHKNASSSGGPGSSLQFFLQERNRIYFGLKFAVFKTKIHLIIKAIEFLFSQNYKITLSLVKIFI